MNATPDPVERLTSALEDRYAIEQEIGSGGMAVVFQAQDRKHNRNPSGLADSFVLTPDGRSILAYRRLTVTAPADAPAVRLVLVENWLEEVRQMLRAPR